MPIAIDPCFVAFAVFGIMVIGFRSEFAIPLVKQTKNYTHDNAEQDLTPRQFFERNSFWWRRSNGFSFNLTDFCGRCLRIQQGNGCLGIRSANEQTHTTRCSQIRIHPAAIIGINPTLDTVSFKICRGQFCGFMAAEKCEWLQFSLRREDHRWRIRKP
jgi:hypothetical protein